MGWLIDTGIWIAVERGALGAADIHAVTRQEPVYLSPVNIAEMQSGLEMLRAGPLRQRAAAAIRRLRLGGSQAEGPPIDLRAARGARRGGHPRR